jgi:Rrf2 family protein
MSDHHVAKVLQQLQRAGIVESVRGASGGYRLAREPSELTMADVIEVLEGSIEPVCFGCDGRLAGECGHYAACVVRDTLTGLGKQMLKTFRGTTIATLAARGKRAKNRGDEACLHPGPRPKARALKA